MGINFDFLKARRTNNDINDTSSAGMSTCYRFVTINETMLKNTPANVVEQYFGPVVILNLFWFYNTLARSCYGFLIFSIMLMVGCIVNGLETLNSRKYVQQFGL